MKLRTQPVKWIVMHHWGGWPPKTQHEAENMAKNEGYSAIPYNAIFLEDGTKLEGRDEKFVSAANLGVNETAIAFCLAGNFDEGDNPTGKKGWPLVPSDAQLLEAGMWVREKRKQYPQAKLIQHKDVVKLVPTARLADGRVVSTATACPGSRAVKMKAARIIWLIACGHTLESAKKNA